MEQALPAPPCWRGIAGYSLAGLFALYALYGTPLFTRAASVSGSLWYPGIRQYLFTHVPLVQPEKLYFSLGDRESRTRNPLLCQVEQNTREIYQFYQSRGVNTLLKMNPGNHYRQAPQRTAAGLLWLLRD